MRSNLLVIEFYYNCEYPAIRQSVSEPKVEKKRRRKNKNCKTITTAARKKNIFVESVGRKALNETLNKKNIEKTEKKLRKFMFTSLQMFNLS